MSKIAIRTENLTRDFGSVRAVDDLSLEIPVGIVFGFLGPNGSGKTTTIRLLLGLLEPARGRAEVLGLDTQTQADEIRERCGALLEHAGLYERLSAEDNLELYGRIWRLSAADRKARTKELLTHLGLWERRGEKVAGWSRGMRQKLAVARSLLHRPSLIFLDEPTAGLDPMAAAALREDLLSLAGREGVTIFLTTHNLTMMWKEWKEMLLQHGGIRSGILPMVIIPLGLMGVMLPWQMGRAWVESPLTLTVWAWMPLMLMASLIADSFAGERERHTLETLLASRLPDRAILFGKVCAVVSYGWGLTMLGVLMGLLTVNLVHGRGKLLLYSWKFTLSVLALSWLGSWLAAGAGVLVSLRAATVRQAQQVLMVAIMLLLFVPVYGVQLLPAEWRAQIAGTLAAGGATRLVLGIIVALTVVDTSLIIAAMARFRRARLILN